ncbi:MAG: competence/damage-inducible protein A [Phycisphaeraceae bacterium]
MPITSAAILAIGDELVLGQTVDTNTAWIAQRLAARGIMANLHLTVPDDHHAIRDAFLQAADTAPWVIVTGGLGPTADDLTRFALAEAMGVDLVEDADALSTLKTWFEGRGKPMPQRNRVQAMIPRTASALPNPVGTAPGIHAKLNNAQVFVMPGVPRELFAIYQERVEPTIVAASGGNILMTRKINTFGVGESAIGETLSDLMTRDANPTIGTTVSGGVVSVRIRASGTRHDDVVCLLSTAQKQVETRLCALVYGLDDTLLQDATIALLREKNMTVATAESCTGGMISASLTDVAGSSAVFLGGFVTYANDRKINDLAIDEDTLSNHGAVSAAVARAMAQGARQRTGADIAIATTGIAGPEGGTPDKPVGTVWFGLATPSESCAYHAKLRGDRAMIRNRSKMIALQLIRFATMGEDPAQMDWLTADSAVVK